MGRKMHVNREAVIRAAAELADAQGLSGVSLKSVAEKLHIRTPSLYNHISGLEELLRETAHQGMRNMNIRMLEAAAGCSGDQAVHAVSQEYLSSVLEHPGVYEIIQWATWHGTEETEAIFGTYTSLLQKLLCSCGLPEETAAEEVSLMTGLLHGFVTLQLRSAFSAPDETRHSLQEAVDTVLLGLQEKYGSRRLFH